MVSLSLQGIIHGETSPYSLICELFMKYVLHEEDVDSRIKLDKEDMIDVSTEINIAAPSHLANVFLWPFLIVSRLLLKQFSTEYWFLVDTC